LYFTPCRDMVFKGQVWLLFFTAGQAIYYCLEINEMPGRSRKRLQTILDELYFNILDYVLHTTYTLKSKLT